MMLKEFLKKYLGHNREALTWVSCYLIYCHGLDDQIDNCDSELIIKNADLASVLFAYPFYIEYFNILNPILRFAGNAYLDSIKMEKSNSKWKQDFANVLRSQANDVVLASIEIVSGVEKRREASIELREISYKDQNERLTYDSV